MSRDNRCGPDDHNEIHDDWKEAKGKTDLEGLSRDGCSLSLGGELRFARVVDD